MAACNTAAARFFLTAMVVVFAAAAALAPLAEAQIFSGLTVSSRVCCTDTGNCPGKALVRTVVKLNCTRGLFSTATVGRSTTTSSGFFNITSTKTGVPLGLPVLPCFAVIQLPVSASICPALSTVSGTLTSAVFGVGSVYGKLGRLQNATTLGFSLRPII
ncbi:hypothetical protein ABFS82_11G019000 [Erythranthe guttata]